MGRNQNLDKQELSKLVVPRLVARLQAFFDEHGAFYCDNVDVGGVLTAEDSDAWYVLGVLNSPVANFFFNWLSKPFRGEYLSANKQFIAPLPIPAASAVQTEALGSLARSMQSDFTARVQVRDDIAQRLGRLAVVKQPLEWLLPGIRSVSAIEDELQTIRSGLKAVAKSREDKRNLKTRVLSAQKSDTETAYSDLRLRLSAASELDVIADRGSVRFLSDGAVVAQAFVGNAEAPLVTAQWQSVALTFDPGVRDAPKKLIEALRRVALAGDQVLVDQVVALAGELDSLTRRIREHEKALHEQTCVLFGLTAEERQMVETGR